MLQLVWPVIAPPLHLLSPVFDLQQVADEAVAGTALDKVSLCGEEGLSGVATMLLQEVVEQWQLALLLHLMDGHGVHHGLNHTTVWRDHQDLVRLDPQRHTLLLPDSLVEGEREREMKYMTYQSQLRETLSLSPPPSKSLPSNPLQPGMSIWLGIFS